MKRHYFRQRIDKSSSACCKKVFTLALPVPRKMEKITPGLYIWAPLGPLKIHEIAKSRLACTPCSTLFVCGLVDKCRVCRKSAHPAASPSFHLILQDMHKFRSAYYPALLAVSKKNRCTRSTTYSQFWRSQDSDFQPKPVPFLLRFEKKSANCWNGKAPPNGNVQHEFWNLCISWFCIFSTFLGGALILRWRYYFSHVEENPG